MTIHDEVLDLAQELFAIGTCATFEEAEQEAAAVIADLLADPDLHGPYWPWGAA